MKRVLIVDDNSDERKILKVILERQAFEVTEAGDGVEGLEKALQTIPDVIIADALMPRMDGFQFLREVKKDQRLKSIPFIFYSAVYSGYKEAELAVFLGALAFIARPKEPEEFWKELSRVLEERAVAATDIVPAMKLLEEDQVFLEKYSQIVVGKLVETVAELEKTVGELKHSQKALEESEERLRMAAFAGGIGTFDINVESGEVFQSPEMTNMLGLPSDAPRKIKLQEAWQFVHPEDIEWVKQDYFNSLDARGNGLFQEEHRFVRKDGDVRWFLTRGRTFFEGVGDRKRAVRSIGVILDITERRRAEEALRESEERFLKMTSTALDAVILMDNDGNVSFWNEGAARMFGYTGEEAGGKELYSLIMPERYRSAYLKGFEAFRLSGTGPFIGKVYEFEGKRKNGAEFPVEIALASLEIKGKWNAIGIARDITERKRLEDEIRHIGNHDLLTGLPNRRLFRELLDIELAQAGRNGKKACILFLDLDRFKEINDALGHQAGDVLITEASERLKNHVRKSDTISRIGGDEFNIIVTDIVRPEDSAEVARNIVNAFRKPFIIAGHELNSTASIGISIYPDDSRDADTLLRYADIALHHAKHLGKNNYHFYESSINVTSLERMRLESMLQRSIDLGEMVVYYQPLVDIASRRITCVEALARWRHPEKGVLEPKDFIPSAEEIGLINAIDELALMRGCRQVRAWLNEGIHLCVSVNLSARQFHGPGLVRKISSIVEETGIPPGCLDLEVTETIAMADVEQSVAKLKELSKMGILISIDDFGTGYSSLNYLKKLPINRLKIDKSFIQDIPADADDRTIVETVIAMAHNMKMKVVAEGVETEEQLEFLRRAGCDEMQGYLYSRPVPAEKFAALVSGQELFRRSGSG